MRFLTRSPPSAMILTFLIPRINVPPGFEAPLLSNLRGLLWKLTLESPFSANCFGAGWSDIHLRCIPLDDGVVAIRVEVAAQPA